MPNTTRYCVLICQNLTQWAEAFLIVAMKMATVAGLVCTSLVGKPCDSGTIFSSQFVNIFIQSFLHL